METREDIKEVWVKLRKTYYKGYQRALELDCSTLHLKFTDNMNHYNLVTEPCNELENMLRSHVVFEYEMSAKLCGVMFLHM